MRLIDQIRSVRHTFDANRGRTALTLVGIMIGAGSIVLLASLLTGGQQALLDHDQEATGSDVVQVDADEVPVQQTQKTRRELNQVDAQLRPAARSCTTARTGITENMSILAPGRLARREPPRCDIVAVLTASMSHRGG